MSVLPIGITADDLTGAADTAAAFVRPDAPVSISLAGRPRIGAGRRACAVTTDSRTCPPEEAYDLVAGSVRMLLEEGVHLIYKKVDSNLRGNIGAELAAARDTAGAPLLFAPAFPARGRTTVEGVGLVEGVPIAETEMAVDPEAPVRYSDIGELIRSQATDLPVGQCSLRDVRAGAAAVTAYVREEAILALDAQTDADLEAIAQAALSLSPPPVLAGSAGLAAAVARQLFGPPQAPRWPPRRHGPILAILASSSQGLLSQVSQAATRLSTDPIPLPCENLTREEEPVPELGKAIARARAELDAGRDTIVYAAGPLPRVERPVELVVEHLAHLAFVLVKQARPRGLLVGGGATAQAVLAVLRAEAIEVDDEPAPGVAGGLVVDGDLAGHPIVLKPGAAGDDEAVAMLLRYLGQRATALETAQ